MDYSTLCKMANNYSAIFSLRDIEGPSLNINGRLDNASFISN